MRQLLLLGLTLFLHHFNYAKHQRLVQKGGTLKEAHGVKDRPGTPKANLLRAGAGTIFRNIASWHVRFSAATGLRLIG